MTNMLCNQTSTSTALTNIKLNTTAQSLIEWCAVYSLVPDPDDPRHLILECITLLPVDHSPIVLDPADKNLKDKPYRLKEGCQFQIQLRFYIQHELVSGLKFVNSIYRMKVRVDRDITVIGSYAPKTEVITYTTQLEEVDIVCFLLVLVV